MDVWEIHLACPGGCFNPRGVCDREREKEKRSRVRFRWAMHEHPGWGTRDVGKWRFGDYAFHIIIKLLDWIDQYRQKIDGWDDVGLVV